MNDAQGHVRSTRDTADPLLVGRIRAGLLGVLISSMGYGLVVPWLTPDGGLPFLACILAGASTVSIALLLLRHGRSTADATRIGEIACGVLIAVTVPAGVLMHRPPAPMIPVVLTMAAGAFLPWGRGPQTRVAAFASATVIVGLATFGSGFGGYPTLTALLGIGLSVPMAGAVARERSRILLLAEARREADERFRSLAASTPEVFWWLGPEGNHVSFVSQAFVEIWGRPIADALGNPRQLWETIHPDDRERIGRAILDLAEGAFDEEFRIVRPDGSLRTVHARGYLVHDGPDGAPRLSGLTEDVTERRATEAALRTSERRYAGLLDNAPDPILTFDGAGRLRSANPASARLFGWATSDLSGGRFRFLRVVAPASRSVALHIARELAARGLARPADLEILRSDGARVLVEANQRLLATANGEVEVEVILRDITERRRAEEAERLRGLNAHMEAAREDSRRRLARQLHDELAQPLAALRLEMSCIAQDAPRGPDDLAEQTRNMSALVESVIAAAQGMIADLRPSVLDDFGLAEAVRWQTRAFAAKASIECTADVMPDEIRCSQDRAVAVFRTLQEALAAVAAQPGTRRVRVELRDLDGVIVLTVLATGWRLPSDAHSSVASFSWDIVQMRERAHLHGGDLEVSAVDAATVKIRLRISGEDVPRLERHA